MTRVSTAGIYVVTGVLNKQVSTVGLYVVDREFIATIVSTDIANPNEAAQFATSFMQTNPLNNQEWTREMLINLNFGARILK